VNDDVDDRWLGGIGRSRIVGSAAGAELTLQGESSFFLGYLGMVETMTFFHSNFIIRNSECKMQLSNFDAGLSFIKIFASKMCDRFIVHSIPIHG
jgi:hypothetical protein